MTDENLQEPPDQVDLSADPYKPTFGKQRDYQGSDEQLAGQAPEPDQQFGAVEANQLRYAGIDHAERLIDFAQKLDQLFTSAGASSQALSEETTARTAEDNSIRAALVDETTARIAGDDTNAQLIEAETQARLAQAQEMLSQIASLLNDSAVSGQSAWSSQKTSDEIASAIQSLVGAAPESLDTIQELAEAIEAHPDALAAIQSLVDANRSAIDMEVAERQQAEVVQAAEISAVKQIAEERALPPEDLSKSLLLDGVTDETQEVQAILDNAGSRPVYLPSGKTLAISSRLKVNDGQRIYGDGDTSMIRMLTGSSDHAVVLANSTVQATLEKIKIDCSASTSGQNNGVYQIGGNVRYKGVTFANAAHSGLRVHSGGKAVIEDCTATGCYTNGLYVSIDSDAHIDALDASDNFGNGLSVYASTGAYKNIVANNNQRMGVVFTHCENGVTLQDVQANSNGSTGVAFGGISAAGKGANKGYRAVGVSAENNGQIGFSIDPTVAGSDEVHDQQAVVIDVVTQGNSNNNINITHACNVKVYGAVANNGQLHGVALTNSQCISLHGVTANDNSARGIAVFDSKGVTEGHIFIGCSAQGNPTGNLPDDARTLSQYVGWFKRGGGLARSSGKYIHVLAASYAREDESNQLVVNEYPKNNNVTFDIYTRNGKLDTAHDGTDVSVGTQLVTIAHGWDNNGVLSDVASVGADTNDGIPFHFYQDPATGRVGCLLPQKIEATSANAFIYDDARDLVLPAELQGWAYIGKAVVVESSTGVSYIASNSKNEYI